MNPNDQRGGVVDLVNLISCEFGISPIIAKDQLREAQIEIDGQPYTGRDNYSVPIDQLRNRELVVVGETFHWRYTYRD